MKFQTKWNDALIKTAQCIGTKISYGGNVVFPYYILNREMINYSRVPLNVFTKHFAETSSESLAQKSQIKVPPLIGDNLHFKCKMMRHWRAEPNKNFDHDLLT